MTARSAVIVAGLNSTDGMGICGVNGANTGGMQQRFGTEKLGTTIGTANENGDGGLGSIGLGIEMQPMSAYRQLSKNRER